MTNTESTSASSWQERGWELQPFNIPSWTETFVVYQGRLDDAVEEPSQASDDDEPLFGTHLREAGQVLRRIVLK